MILAGIVAFTIIIAILAYNIHYGVDRGENTLRDDRESARIATVVVQTVIEEPPFDAEDCYKTVCFACHDTGAAEAPKLEAAAWVDRLAKGEEALAASAINGIGLMPPKGGRMDLSDEDVTAIVGYMISKVQE